MSGATVDDYVMGRLRDPKSLSPGLAANTLAMCEFTYGSRSKPRCPPSTAATSSTAEQPAEAAPAKQSLGTRKRRAAPSRGFHAGRAFDK
eukprot:1003619-Pleurochrysis_carterae.AAC.1